MAINLKRIGNSVYFGEKKLTIVAQATKGPGKEVVKIEGLEGSNGQKWIALNRLKEGENIIECSAHATCPSGSSGGRDYELTETEKMIVAEHQKAIDDIIARAKARYVKKPKILSINEVQKMNDLEKTQYMQMLEAYVTSLKA